MQEESYSDSETNSNQAGSVNLEMSLVPRSSAASAVSKIPEIHLNLDDLPRGSPQEPKRAIKENQTNDAKEGEDEWWLNEPEVDTWYGIDPRSRRPIYPHSFSQDCAQCSREHGLSLGCRYLGNEDRYWNTIDSKPRHPHSFGQICPQCANEVGIGLWCRFTMVKDSYIAKLRDKKRLEATDSASESLKQGRCSGHHTHVSSQPCLSRRRDGKKRNISDIESSEESLEEERRSSKRRKTPSSVLLPKSISKGKRKVDEVEPSNDLSEQEIPSKRCKIVPTKHQEPIGDRSRKYSKPSELRNRKTRGKAVSVKLPLDFQLNVFETEQGLKAQDIALSNPLLPLVLMDGQVIKLRISISVEDSDDDPNMKFSEKPCEAAYDGGNESDANSASRSSSESVSHASRQRRTFSQIEEQVPCVVGAEKTTSSDNPGTGGLQDGSSPPSPECSSSQATLQKGFTQAGGANRVEEMASTDKEREFSHQNNKPSYIKPYSWWIQSESQASEQAHHGDSAGSTSLAKQSTGILGPQYSLDGYRKRKGLLDDSRTFRSAKKARKPSPPRRPRDMRPDAIEIDGKFYYRSWLNGGGGRLIEVGKGRIAFPGPLDSPTPRASTPPFEDLAYSYE